MEALQALQWDDDDDTPFDIATKYKEEGNRLFGYKKYRNAIINYTEGIKQRCSDPTVNAVLFCNRATAQYYLGKSCSKLTGSPSDRFRIVLGNHRSALKDCLLSRKCKPDHLKAYVKGHLFLHFYHVILIGSF